MRRGDPEAVGRVELGEVEIAEAQDVTVVDAEFLHLREARGEQPPAGVAARGEIEVPMPQRRVRHLPRILMEQVDREIDVGPRDAGSGRDAMERSDRLLPLRGVAMQRPHHLLELGKDVRRLLGEGRDHDRRISRFRGARGSRY